MLSITGTLSMLFYTTKAISESARTVLLLIINTIPSFTCRQTYSKLMKKAHQSQVYRIYNL